MAETNNLLSFKKWNAANPSIPFNKKLELYQNYLETALVTDIGESDSVKVNQLKESYKSFLRRLTVIYQDDPEIRKLQGLDFNDRRQLISAIPIFSSKIRDIAIYYQKKRKELKNKKEEYSIKGTEQGLERAIKFLFLNKYSKDGDYFDPSIEDVSIVENLQERTKLQENLQIEIETLYNI